MSKTGNESFRDAEGSELIHIINKETREGLTSEEEERKAYLIELFKSGK